MLWGADIGLRIFCYEVELSIIGSSGMDIWSLQDDVFAFIGSGCVTMYQHVFTSELISVSGSLMLLNDISSLGPEESLLYSKQSVV